MDFIIKRRLTGLAHSLIDLIYPPLCRHCQSALNERSHLLCEGCLPYLELADPHSICAYCVKPVEGRTVCVACAALRTVYRRVIVTCEAQGPASTLLRQFQQGDAQLNQPIGSLMAMQVIQQNRPLPDLIVPLPGSLFQTVRHGFDGNHLLAEQLSEILKRPVHRALSRKVFSTELGSMRLKKGTELCDRRVMLIVGRFEQEEARQAACELSKGFPLEIEVLCFL